MPDYIKSRLGDWGLIVVTVIALGGVAVWATKYRGDGSGDLVPWRTDYDSALNESLETHKPIFLLFSATWCGPCQSLHKELWNSPAVNDALASYIPVHLDVDNYDNAVRLHNMGGSGGIPCMMVVSGGHVTQMSIGAIPKSYFLSWLHGGM